MEGSIFEETKLAFSASSGSAILRYPSHPLYSLYKQFQDALCHQLPLIFTSRYRCCYIHDSVPRSTHYVTHQWPPPTKQYNVTEQSFRANHTIEVVRERKHSH